MPFPPEEFCAVAADLRDRKPLSGEGRHRTVVGRAYYGAYLATCWAICRTHRIDPARDMGHETVANTLASVRGDEDLRKLGNLLNTLRFQRIQSDYKLANTVSEDEADDAVGDAKKVLELVAAVAVRLPKIEPRAE